MSRNYPVTVLTFSDGKSISYERYSFKDVMTEIFSNHLFDKRSPLKITIPSKSLMLYCNMQTIHNYLQGEISRQELEEYLRCDNLYRNTLSVKTDLHPEEIDEGCLWRRIGDDVILINDDLHVQTPFKSELFEII